MHFDNVAERSDLVTINAQEAVNDEAWELGIVKVMKPIPLEGTLTHCHVNPGDMPTAPIYSLGKKKPSQVNVDV